MYICIHTCMYDTHIHACINTIHTCMYEYTHTCKHKYMHTYIRTYIHTCGKPSDGIQLQMYICIFTCTYTHACINTYTHAESRRMIYTTSYVHMYIHVFWNGIYIHIMHNKNNRNSISMYACVYVCMYACMYQMYVRMCTCLERACTYIHSYAKLNF